MAQPRGNTHSENTAMFPTADSVGLRAWYPVHWMLPILRYDGFKTVSEARLPFMTETVVDNLKVKTFSRKSN